LECGDLSPLLGTGEFQSGDKSPHSKFSLLGLKAFFVGHHVTIFQISFKEPEIHGPAVTRYLVVVVSLRPTAMMESDLSNAVLLFQHEANPRVSPIFMRLGELQLELSRRDAPRDRGPPIVIGTKVQLVLSSRLWFCC